jgi:hypothetical protein
MKKKLFSFAWLLMVLAMAGTAFGGLNDRDSGINLTVDNKIELPQISAPAGNPKNNTGWLYVKDSSGTTKLYFEDDAGTVHDLITAAGVTLDGAYDYGGAGSGRAVTVDSGAITLTNNAADNNGVLEITKNPVGAQSGAGLSVTMGAQASGAALSFTNTGSGNDITGSGGTWSVTKAGAMTVASITHTGLFTTTGITSTGAAVNLNANSNYATNLNTGTSTGAVSIGGGLGTVAVNSSTWDVSTAGAFTGVTGITMSGNMTLANGNAIRGSAVSGETLSIQVYDNDTGPGYKDAILLTNGNTPAIAIGDGNPTITINSADWDISATGDMTGIGAVTMDGLLTGTLGATITGAAVNLNASSNFAVNIASGTSTGTITIGSAANQTINVGTGAAVKLVNVGSTNTTSTTTINSGSGGVGINGSNNQPTNINTGTSTGTVTIGNATGPAVVTEVGTYTVNHDAAAMTTGVGTGTTTGTITIGGAGNQTVHVGNGAANKTVNLGSSTGTSTTTLLSGSGGILINNNNNQNVGICTGTSTGTVTLGAAGSFVTVAGTITGATPLIFDGNTADANQTSLAVADPTADRTITLPDYTGGVPLVIAQSATQTSQAGAGTADVTGSSLSMASGWFSATKTLRYTLTGTKTGANAAMVVHLYLLDAQVMSLTASDAAAGDWTATFVVHEYTGTANQKITGTLQVNGKVSVVDYAAATKNMAAGATTIKAQIQSQNAGDTVTNEYVNIEHWVK